MVVSSNGEINIIGDLEGAAGLRLNNNRQKLRQRFDIVRKLGQGTYGKVQLAVNKDSGEEVAIKTIKKAKIETEQDLVRIQREIQIMSSVQHPHIIHIYEVFENKEKIVLVMEYANGGELYDYLSYKKTLGECEARRLFRQIVSAVFYCHKNKICHRDLKLENILLDEQGNAKIADFGLSNVFDEKRLLNTFCGSPLYASPEIVKGTPYYGPEVDCWSLGVLLYTLVYGAMPFDGSNFRRLVKQISEGDYYEPKIPSEASGLIRHMLTVQPAKRATVEEVCCDWWVNQGYEQQLLEVAEEMCKAMPVRLDYLLQLVPQAVGAVPPSDEAPAGTVPVAKSGDSMNDYAESGSTIATTEDGSFVAEKRPDLENLNIHGGGDATNSDATSDDVRPMDVGAGEADLPSSRKHKLAASEKSVVSQSTDRVGSVKKKKRKGTNDGGDNQKSLEKISSADKSLSEPSLTKVSGTCVTNKEEATASDVDAEKNIPQSTATFISSPQAKPNKLKSSTLKDNKAASSPVSQATDQQASASMVKRKGSASQTEPAGSNECELQNNSVKTNQTGGHKQDTKDMSEGMDIDISEKTGDGSNRSAPKSPEGKTIPKSKPSLKSSSPKANDGLSSPTSPTGSKVPKAIDGLSSPTSPTSSKVPKAGKIPPENEDMLAQEKKKQSSLLSMKVSDARKAFESKPPDKRSLVIPGMKVSSARKSFDATGSKDAGLLFKSAIPKPKSSDKGSKSSDGSDSNDGKETTPTTKTSKDVKQSSPDKSSVLKPSTLDATKSDKVVDKANIHSAERAKEMECATASTDKICSAEEDKETEKEMVENGQKRTAGFLPTLDVTMAVKPVKKDKLAGKPPHAPRGSETSSGENTPDISAKPPIQPGKMGKDSNESVVTVGKPPVRRSSFGKASVSSSATSSASSVIEVTAGKATNKEFCDNEPTSDNITSTLAAETVLEEPVKRGSRRASASASKDISGSESNFLARALTKKGDNTSDVLQSKEDDKPPPSPSSAKPKKVTSVEIKLNSGGSKKEKIVTSSETTKAVTPKVEQNWEPQPVLCPTSSGKFTLLGVKSEVSFNVDAAEDLPRPTENTSLYYSVTLPPPPPLSPVGDRNDSENPAVAGDADPKTVKSHEALSQNLNSTKPSLPTPPASVYRHVSPPRLPTSPNTEVQKHGKLVEALVDSKKSGPRERIIPVHVEESRPSTQQAALEAAPSPRANRPDRLNLSHTKPTHPKQGNSPTAPSGSPPSSSERRSRTTQETKQEQDDKSSRQGYGVYRSKFKSLRKGFFDEAEPRRREPSLDRSESFSSTGSTDDLEDIFENLTSDSLVSNLLSRTRSIIQEMTTDDFPQRRIGSLLGRSSLASSRLSSFRSSFDRPDPFSRIESMLSRRGDSLGRSDSYRKTSAFTDATSGLGSSRMSRSATTSRQNSDAGDSSPSAYSSNAWRTSGRAGSREAPDLESYFSDSGCGSRKSRSNSTGGNYSRSNSREDDSSVSESSVRSGASRRNLYSYSRSVNSSISEEDVRSCSSSSSATTSRTASTSRFNDDDNSTNFSRSRDSSITRESFASSWMDSSSSASTIQRRASWSSRFRAGSGESPWDSGFSRYSKAWSSDNHSSARGSANNSFSYESDKGESAPRRKTSQPDFDSDSSSRRRSREEDIQQSTRQRRDSSGSRRSRFDTDDISLYGTLRRPRSLLRTARSVANELSGQDDDDDDHGRNRMHRPRSILVLADPDGDERKSKEDERSPPIDAVKSKFRNNDDMSRGGGGGSGGGRSNTTSSGGGHSGSSAGGYYGSKFSGGSGTHGGCKDCDVEPPPSDCSKNSNAANTPLSSPVPTNDNEVKKNLDQLTAMSPPEESTEIKKLSPSQGSPNRFGFVPSLQQVQESTLTSEATTLNGQAGTPLSPQESPPIVAISSNSNTTPDESQPLNPPSANKSKSGIAVWNGPSVPKEFQPTTLKERSHSSALSLNTNLSKKHSSSCTISADMSSSSDALSDIPFNPARRHSSAGAPDMPNGPVKRNSTANLQAVNGSPRKSFLTSPTPTTVGNGSSRYSSVSSDVPDSPRRYSSTSSRIASSDASRRYSTSLSADSSTQPSKRYSSASPAASRDSTRRYSTAVCSELSSEVPSRYSATVTPGDSNSRIKRFSSSISSEMLSNGDTDSSELKTGAANYWAKRYGTTSRSPGTRPLSMYASSTNEDKGVNKVEANKGPIINSADKDGDSEKIKLRYGKYDEKWVGDVSSQSSPISPSITNDSTQFKNDVLQKTSKADGTSSKRDNTEKSSEVHKRTDKSSTSLPVSSVDVSLGTIKSGITTFARSISSELDRLQDDLVNRFGQSSNQRQNISDLPCSKNTNSVTSECRKNSSLSSSTDQVSDVVQELKKLEEDLLCLGQVGMCDKNDRGTVSDKSVSDCDNTDNESVITEEKVSKADSSGTVTPTDMDDACSVCSDFESNRTGNFGEESVSERIRRKSYYPRFQDSRLAKKHTPRKSVDLGLGEAPSYTNHIRNDDYAIGSLISPPASSRSRSSYCSTGSSSSGYGTLKSKRSQSVVPKSDDNSLSSVYATLTRRKSQKLPSNFANNDGNMSDSLSTGDISGTEDNDDEPVQPPQPTSSSSEASSKPSSCCSSPAMPRSFLRRVSSPVEPPKTSIPTLTVPSVGRRQSFDENGDVSPLTWYERRRSRQTAPSSSNLDSTMQSRAKLRSRHDYVINRALSSLDEVPITSRPFSPPGTTASRLALLDNQPSDLRRFSSILDSNSNPRDMLRKALEMCNSLQY